MNVASSVFHANDEGGDADTKKQIYLHGLVSPRIMMEARKLSTSLVLKTKTRFLFHPPPSTLLAVKIAVLLSENRKKC